MAYIEQLIRQSQSQMEQTMFINQSWLGKPEGLAYASLYPEWEVTTPQYLSPNAYSLAQMGFRTNEVVFTSINVRADSLAEAPLSVWNNESDPWEEIKKHGVGELLNNPCPGVSEQTFWKIVETYLGIAGFSAWEKERDNLGRVIRLWPMRPDWCSFLRGQGKPIRAIRYQPYGLPWFDVPIEDILLFAYFDPLWPLLKPFSPTMSALEIIDVDNNMTLMLNNFIKNGAFLGGVLSTENQILQENEAEVYKHRWREAHGGAANAGDIAVIGKGLKFQTTNNTFRDMVFPEVDARSEARITMVFRVPPMLIGAKIGLDRSTYSNYQEARKGFYEGPVSAEWKFLAGIVRDQLLPDFEGDRWKSFSCSFKTNDVKALQEDRTAQVDRADKMFKGKWATKNEARKEAGLDPVDDGDDFSKDIPNPLLNGGINNTNDEESTNKEKPNNLAKENVEQEPPRKTKEQQDLEDAEKKKFMAYANKRIKEDKFEDIREYEFLYLPPKEQEELIKRFETKAIISQLEMVTDEAN